MAKKVETDDPSKKPNGPHPEVVMSIIKAIEGEREGMLSLKMTYVQNCKPFHERINNAFEKARGAGIKKKALREILHKRELERKLEAVGADLEDEDLDSFEAIEQALGALNGTPLGEAVKERRRPAPKAEASKPEAEPEAAKPGRSSRRAPSPNATAAENAERLEAGITRLN